MQCKMLLNLLPVQQPTAVFMIWKKEKKEKKEIMDVIGTEIIITGTTTEIITGIIIGIIGIEIIGTTTKTECTLQEIETNKERMY